LWQTIWKQLLPAAIPGIATGAILAISRAIGEAAPLILIGATTFITFTPDGLLSRYSGGAGACRQPGNGSGVGVVL
jgi:phosphate transport system permease protein